MFYHSFCIHPCFNYGAGIPDGRIVGIALKRRLGVERVDPSGLFDMMEKWAYGSVDNSSLKFRDYKFHGAWAMIKKQGKIYILKSHHQISDHFLLAYKLNLTHLYGKLYQMFDKFRGFFFHFLE